MRRRLALILIALVAASATALAWDSVKILEFNSRLLDGEKKSAASPFDGGALLDGYKGSALADEVSRGLSEIIAQAPSFDEPLVFDSAALEVKFTDSFEALGSEGFDVTFTDQDLGQNVISMENALIGLHQLSFGESVDMSTSQRWKARIGSGYSAVLSGSAQSVASRS
ncbi:MAG: hypothetical protein N3G75_07555 [Methanothrix sp.]|nr:hypothetical protein [Methanothrix sp.]MCX8207674.1 hypothetical protein [Methanothrix sp.]